MKYSRIIGTGSYLPQHVLTNADLEKMVDTTDEWIVGRTGIRSRHILSDGESGLSMSKASAEKAIEAAGIDKKDIDLIIVATTTPDTILPTTACRLQAELGIAGCPAFDLSAACAGFSYALSVADNFIRNGGIKNALVIGTECLSKIVDWQDRGTCILFGDGSGAVILQASDEPGILSTHIHAAGQYKDVLYATDNFDAKQLPKVIMQGSELFKVAVNKLGEVVQEALEANNLDSSAIDWFIPHQANLRIIQAMAKKFNIPMEKVILTIDKHGNTSAASIPLALDIAVRDGRVKPGQILLLESFGGGVTWASALVKY